MQLPVDLTDVLVIITIAKQPVLIMDFPVLIMDFLYYYYFIFGNTIIGLMIIVELNE